MNFKNLNWSIDTILKNAHSIDPKPQYQRGPVWGVTKQQLLIDSIVNRFDIPKIYLRHLKGGVFDYEVADGQQRLNAIWDFAKDKFPLAEIDTPNERWSGKLYSQLTVAEKRHIHTYKLTVTTVYDATGDQIRELFARLQKGERLNPAELRNSMPSALGDVIRAMASTHLFFAGNAFASARYKHDDLLAHAFAIVLYSGTRDLKAPDLALMYREYKDAVEQACVKRVNKSLMYMAEVQRAGSNCIRTKWGFVDIFSIVANHLASLPSADVLAKRYRLFEQNRLLYTKDPSLLITPGRSASDRQLYDYIVAFNVSGGLRDNLAKRYSVLASRLLK
ncbi:DUF262 domain-containing protein [Verrucomicrobiota bacterium sgz303538]